MSERWQRVKSIFERAIELEGALRQSWLVEACGADADLLAEVRGMLAADAAGDSFLDANAHAALGTASDLEADPTEARRADDSETGPPRESIGPYRLLEKLGEGGMGEVWLAEQRQPVERRVALKIIKPGMDSAMVIARFAAERQALARMDHAAVARVYDAGTTAGGRSYFVMEYIRGLPITQHCDRARLTTRERLDLVREVCEGVQHAHQRGIIHRDLKPSNVLVTHEGGRSTPKIIDFGVAKATEGRLTDETLHTVAGAMIGTPEYMSPEQADLTAQDVDVRTDVYALGVLLYELLTGSLPFDAKELRTRSFDELRRQIREVDPPTPSSRFATLEGNLSTVTARARRTDPVHLRRELKGDLDWIVMCALEKERARRYGSPAELAAEIRRYLADEPVLAGPPSTRYRARKFVRRHRIAVGFTAVLATSLVGFALTMAFQARRIARERDRATKLAAELHQVAEFRAEQFAGIDPATMGARLRQSILAERRVAFERAGAPPAGGIEPSLAELERDLAPVNFTNVALGTLQENFFARALETIDAKFADQPLVRARLLQSLAGTLARLSLPGALAAQEEAVRIRKALLGDDDLETLDSVLKLAYVRRGSEAARLGIGIGPALDHDGTAAMAEDVLARRTRLLGPDHPDTLSTEADLVVLFAKYGVEGEAPLRALLERSVEALGAEHPVSIRIRLDLAHAIGWLRRDAEAFDLAREAADLSLRVLGPSDSLTRRAQDTASWGLEVDSMQSEPYLRESLRRARAELGDDHPWVLWLTDYLAVSLETQGRLEEAEHLELQANEAAKRLGGTPGALTTVLQHNLGFIQYKQGRLVEAEANLREALEHRRKVLGDDFPDTVGNMGNLALVLAALGRLDEAESLARESVERGVAAFSSGFWLVGNSRGQLGVVLTAHGRYAEAETELTEAHSILDAALGPDHERTRRVAGYLVELYEAWEKSIPGGKH